MADNWIKWVVGLTRRREIVAMAEELKLDRRQVAGLFMELMEWADENTVDGNVRGVTKAFPDMHVGVRGFAEAMEKVGWLREKKDGIFFVGFTKHNAQTSKSRALTTRRVKRWRNAAIVTKALPEKIREEVKKTNPPKPPQGGGVVLTHQETGEEATPENQSPRTERRARATRGDEWWREKTG